MDRRNKSVTKLPQKKVSKKVKNPLDFLGYKYYIVLGLQKEGDEMSPTIGRPKSTNPKSNPLHVRLDNETLEILDAYCEQESKKRTEGIRDGILLLKSKIKKE